MKRYCTAIFMLCGLLLTAEAYEIAGPRAAGMGNTFCAYQDDISVIFSNPAGIAGLQYGEMGVLNSRFVDNGNVGLQLGGLQAFKMPLRGRLWPSVVHLTHAELGSFNYMQAGCTLASEDRVLGYPLRWGSTLKYATDTGSQRTALSFDLGVQTDYEPYHVSVGVVARNIFSNDDQLMVGQSAVGGVWRTPYGRLSGECTWDHSTMYISQGFETDVYEGLLVGRLGLLNGQRPFATIGFGVYLWPYAVDAAFGWPTGCDPSASYFQIMVRYRFDGADFSSIYLNNAIEKAMSIEGRRGMKHGGAMGGVATLEPPDYAREVVEHPAPRVTIIAPRQERAITWPQYHVVQSGETLRNLAQKYYGDPNKWQIIYNANAGKIERGQPKVSEELLIPAPK